MQERPSFFMCLLEVKDKNEENNRTSDEGNKHVLQHDDECGSS
jgi:hypothetical protein